jgi:hypothetical protein
MTIVQFRLNLWQQLEQAQAQPQSMDWRQLCLAFEETMDLTPEGLKLATAADAIERLADALAAKASAWAEDWSHQLGDGPVLDEDMFSEFVRQSFSLDLSGLVEEPDLYVRSPSEKSHEDVDSVAEEVTQEVALLLAGTEDKKELEDADSGGDAIAQLEYDEDIGAWVEAIRLWMESGSVESVSIREIIKETNLSAGKVWIAGLLSDLELRQMKDFYSFDGLNLGIKVVSQGEVA